MATQEVELFACERYRPLAGWSASYLLPTDQHAYRARGKKGGWSSLVEAESALLAPGWAWEELRTDGNGEAMAWTVEPGGLACDSAGWAYGVNFTSSYEGAPKKGIQMFTRWRRLVRTQTFSGLSALLAAAQESPAATAGCLNVDLEHAEQVGRLLHEALAAASLYTDGSFPSVVKLKRQLLERLAHKKGDKEKDKEKVTNLEALLEGFVSAQRGVMTRFAELFESENSEAARARISELEARFPAPEREAFATIGVRRFRPDAACAAGAEEHDCPFRPASCPHEGCSERFSAYSLEAHSDACAWKVVPCEKCGEMLPRGKQQTHAAAACPLREACCQFKAIGCDAALSHQDVAAHLDECTQAHLLLVLRKSLEQQELIRTLSARVRQLETSQQAAEAARQAQLGLALKVADLETKFVGLEKRLEKDLGKAADDAKKRSDTACADAKKWADGSTAALRKEIAGLRSELGSTKATVAELDKKVSLDLSDARARAAAREGDKK
eukprot:TRINITY_DN19214_c0_g1_i1.p1 TRINITY_DN19214_c0_g1~~TRINITY_DN19214_c0_g1_i1.p1  ORF type:complete len:500 (+),score=115.84 TRINITY_DN19214_c0_g1_i1:45-1544(+)